MGGGFFERYKAFLADTGRMSTEELAATHLDAGITEPGFWRDTVAAMDPRIENFERLVAATAEASDGPVHCRDGGKDDPRLWRPGARGARPL